MLAPQDRQEGRQILQPPPPAAPPAITAAAAAPEQQPPQPQPQPQPRRGDRLSTSVLSRTSTSSALSRTSTLRQTLSDREEPVLKSGTCTTVAEQSLQKFAALLTAAVCYVAAIAWLLVAYGEMGLDASEKRPVQGWDLASLCCALLLVTVSCFGGVYKLQVLAHDTTALWPSNTD